MAKAAADGQPVNIPARLLGDTDRGDEEYKLKRLNGLAFLGKEMRFWKIRIAAFNGKFRARVKVTFYVTDLSEESSEKTL